jgi:hypothetical protein
MDPNIVAALDLIHEAQNIMETACQRLSSVEGGCKVWQDTCRLRERIHRHFYAVRAMGERLQERARRAVPC